MNRFIKAAIENMEHVEHDHDRERPLLDLRTQWTQEAIAYALIAIAETLQVPEVSGMTQGVEPWYLSDWNRTNEQQS